MWPYLTSITPDSLSGLIFGLEGVKDGVVLLNGPSGCKFYHSATSDNQFIRQLEFDPLNYPEKWYFGQPRVPCTSLDNGDYVYGTEEKLREALIFLRENIEFEILFVVNSPGAALIGDDIAKIAEAEITEKPVLTYETPGISENICAGYERGAVKLLENIMEDGSENSSNGRKRTTLETAADTCGENIAGSIETGGNTASVKPVVNVLGLNLFRRHIFGDALEIRRFLGMIGAEPGCFLLAGCSLREIKEMGGADLNLVLFPEFGLSLAKALKEKCGTDYFVCETPPIGFKATEKLAKELCTVLKTSPERLILESEKMRARCYPFISRLNSLTGMPKGRPFAVEGHWSEAMGYVRFFIEYFAMTADSISILDAECDYSKKAFISMLKEYGMEDALERDIMRTQADMVFASGNTVAALKLQRKEFAGVDISLPTLGYIDVVPKTYLGISGAALLSELIINGSVY